MGERVTERVTVTDRIRRAMMAVVDAVSCHPYAVWGDVAAGRLDAIVEKLVDRYPDLARDRSFAYRLRRAGLPAHRLVVYRPQRKDIQQGFFVLLSSAADDSGEQWRDIRDRHSRVTVYGYELVRHTRPGQSHPSWTWRIEATNYKRIYDQMIDAIDKRKDRWLTDWLHSTTHWPGFAGVRAQHYALKRAFYGRWRRTRRHSEVPPAWPRLSYVTRRAARDEATPPPPPGPLP